MMQCVTAMFVFFMFVFILLCGNTIDKWIASIVLKCEKSKIDKCFEDYEFVEKYNKLKFSSMAILTFFFGAIQFSLYFSDKLSEIEKSVIESEIIYYFSYLVLLLLGIFTMLLINGTIKQMYLLIKKECKDKQT